MLKIKNTIIASALASALAAALIITPALAADGQTTANLNTDMTVTSLGANNPLNGVDVGYYSNPTFVDIDGDGDLAFIGESDNPFHLLDVGGLSTPTFADIDGDGDLDAFIGEGEGNINCYINIGSASAPTFARRTDTDNPLNGADIWNFSDPTFADIDEDGDLDAFIGKFDGTVNYYENTGSAFAPKFVAKTVADNPLNGFDVGNESAPTFVDIDGDGDLDAFIGELDGTINYYKNIGSASAPKFVAKTDANNPFNGVDVGYYSAPIFADLDGDLDLDAFIGKFDGTVNYYENTGSAFAPKFVAKTVADNPLNGVDVGNSSNPTFADIDGDGDLDVFIGELYGTINYYKNIGSSTLPNFLN